MKTLLALLTLMAASVAGAQTVSWVPPPIAGYTSSTGLPDSWQPLTGTGGTTIPYLPPPMGLYYSTDGSGNKGTWAPWNGSGGGGSSNNWQRQGVVITPQGSDPSPQAQEVSAMWDSTPEVLSGYSEVVKMSWTDGWWNSSGGGTGVGLCFGESPDGLAPPTRISAACPLASTVNYARSYMMPTRIGGNITVLATNTTNGAGAIFTGTTMAGLTLTTNNVIACGSNGNEVAGQLGNWAVVNTTGNTWVMLYDCYTTHGNFADWRAVSTTGITGPYTKTSTNPVLLDTSGVPNNTTCVDGGGPWLYYDGTKMWVAIHCGPQGITPTPYIYIGYSLDSGITWHFGSGPNLTAQTADEGVGITTGQIADAYILPDLAGTTGGGNRVTLYYSGYTNGCGGAQICNAPSYIKAATINSTLASVLAGGSVDGAVYRPGLSAYVAPPANPVTPGQVGQWSVANGNLYVYNPNGLSSTWSQINQTAWLGNLQDFATFAGTAGTAISSYTTAAGKTFALYTADGTTQSIPLLTGTGAAILAAGTTATLGDSLDSLTPSSTNYTVSGNFTYTTSGGTPVVALFSRASSGAATYYVLACNLATGTQVCDMFRVVTGTVTQIGGNVNLTWSVGTTHTLSLKITGTTNPVIFATADATTTLFSATDTGGISSVGQAGFRISGGNSTQISNFTVQ